MSNLIGTLKNLANYTEKYLCQSLFFNKVTGSMDVTLLKKKLQHSCFPVNIAKFLKTTILQKTCERNEIWLYLEVSFILFYERKAFENYGKTFIDFKITV